MDVDEKMKDVTENGDGVVKGLDNGDAMAAVPNGGDTAEDEIDPLDAYMNSMVIPEVTKLSTVEVSIVEQTSSDIKKNDKIQNNGKQLKKSIMGRIIPGEDSDSEYPVMDDEEDPLEDEDDDEFMKRVKKTKVEKLSLVDHSKIKYLEFR